MMTNDAATTNARQRLLMIDDDEGLCELLTQYFHDSEFDLHSIHDGIEALVHCQKNQYDAIILDIMLPGKQGLEVLRELRVSNNTPVLMLTAKGDDTDRIIGLEMGADDYLPKPCNPRELIARLRAILRRQKQPKASTENSIQVGLLSLDCGGRSATYDNSPLDLTSTEFNVLKVLANHAGDPVSKSLLYQDALGREQAAYDRSIDVHLSNIRSKLAALGGKDLIISIRGVGYQLKQLAQATSQ